MYLFSAEITFKKCAMNNQYRGARRGGGRYNNSSQIMLLTASSKNGLVCALWIAADVRLHASGLYLPTECTVSAENKSLCRLYCLCGQF